MAEILIKNCRLADHQQITNLLINNGKIAAIAPELDCQAHTIIDGGDKLLLPGFIESHIHLDIALMNDDSLPGRPEPYLSHYGLNDSMERRRRRFIHKDIKDRAVRAMQLASSHGVTAMRAQCHIDREVGLKHLNALLAAKEQCKGIMELQIVGFPQQGLTNHPENVPLFKEALQSGLDVMGAAPNLDRHPDGSIDFRLHIDTALKLAMEFDCDLDVHADLTIPDTISLDELEAVYLARQTIKYNYQGRVSAGHLCGLGSAEPEVADRAIDIIKEAELHVVSQPDLYRLGRDDTKHVRRGLTRVKELLNRGINVSFASNNVRDALRPMGNFNLLEEGLILAYGAHMDTIEELNTLITMCTDNPAKILGLDGYGIQEGCDADLVLLDCTSPSEAIISQAGKLCIIKNGHLVHCSENAKNKLSR